MDITSILGIITAAAALLVGYWIDGGNVLALWLLSAFIMVVGGSIGSVTLSFGIEQLKRFPALLASVFVRPRLTFSKIIDFLVLLSENARKNGLLSLEKIIEEEEARGNVDPFLKRGILMVIDGADLEQIKDFLETDIAVYEQKAQTEISMFESLAAYAPAYGMIGTIMGLIQVLANMESPEQMANAISVAFITTLYGVMIANILCLPAAAKLKMRLGFYQTEKEMIVEGICGIRNGDNPKMLREKLLFPLSSHSGQRNGRKPEAQSPGRDQDHADRRGAPRGKQ